MKQIHYNLTSLRAMPQHSLRNRSYPRMDAL
jgi:hypothetical protein